MYDYNVYENKKSYRIWHCIFRFLAKTLFRIEVLGEENIGSKNFLLSVNHISHIDFIFAPFSKKVNDVHFLAMSELFRKPLQAAFLKSLNCFPVERGNGKANEAIEHAVNLLKKGFNAAICPEGAINKNAPYNPLDAKSGVARIALESHADVLPCCIYCKGKVLPFKRIIISYGKPIPYEELQNVFEKHNNHKIVAEYIFSKTKLMWEESAKNV